MLQQWGAIQIEYTWVMGYPCRVTGIDKETILLSDINHAIECTVIDLSASTRYLEAIVAGQLQALRTEYLETWINLVLRIHMY